MKKTTLVIPALFFATAGLSGCLQQSASPENQPATPAPVVVQSGSTPGGGDGQANSVVRFSDLPMPPQAILDTENSIILGAGEDWTGRVLIQTSNSPESAFDCYRKELPGHGWQEITAVRAATSVLTYVRDGRVATLQLTRSTVGGTDISVTVSPAGKTDTNG